LALLVLGILAAIADDDFAPAVSAAEGEAILANLFDGSANFHDAGLVGGGD
jgi:hypothetical protein